MNGEFEVEEKEKIFKPIQIVVKKQCVRKRTAGKTDKEKQLNLVDHDWVILKSRRSPINKKKYKVCLACICSNCKIKQEKAPTVTLSVDFKDDKIKEVIVLKDNRDLFYSQEKEILSSVEQHLIQEEKIEEVANLL